MKHMGGKFTLFVGGLALVCTACTDSDSENAGGDPDSGVIEARCERAPMDTGIFDLDPSAATPQIHASVAFDGRAIWMAYNLIDGEGNGGFDVFLRRLHCDGSAMDPLPERVTTTLGGNDVDPDLDVGGDRLHVVWSSDTSLGPNNLHVMYRSFGMDGIAMTTNDTSVATEREGAPVASNHWLPQVTALADGTAAVAGIRGINNVFQAFVQRVTDDGQHEEEAMDLIIEEGVTHSSPSIASNANGDLFVAWQRGTETKDQVSFAMIEAGQSTASPQPPPRTGASGSLPNYAVNKETGAVYLAVTTGADVELFDGDSFSEPSRISFGSDGGIDHSPTIATSPEGGAIAWYRTVSGVRNQVWIQGFDDFEDGGTASARGQAVDVGTTGAYSVYAPAITHIKDELYLVVWSEGLSPDLYLKGRIIDLGPEQL